MQPHTIVRVIWYYNGYVVERYIVYIPEYDYVQKEVRKNI